MRIKKEAKRAVKDLKKILVKTSFGYFNYLFAVDAFCQEFGTEVIGILILKYLYNRHGNLKYRIRRHNHWGLDKRGY